MLIIARSIFCCACATDREAILVTGREVYPHRADLADLPFWRCPVCANHVGCHHKTANRTLPLGVIPTSAIRAVRKQIHALIDPLWNGDRTRRREIYQRLGDAIGRDYHTAELRSLAECFVVLGAARRLVAESRSGSARPGSLRRSRA